MSTLATLLRQIVEISLRAMSGAPVLTDLRKRLHEETDAGCVFVRPPRSAGMPL